MEAPRSPPKRLTRARSAVKTQLATSKTASRASKPPINTRTTGAHNAAAVSASKTTTKVAKRKTRPDDAEDELADNKPEDSAHRIPFVTRKTSRATRGGPKKTEASAPKPDAPVEEQLEPAAPAKTTRGRSKKTAEPKEEPLKKRATESTVMAPTRSTRAKKMQSAEEATATSKSALAPAPVKMTTRGRLVSAVASKPATRVGVKKTVTFEEPAKENVVPGKVTKGKKAAEASATPTATGLKAKPVRKVNTNTTTTTRTTETGRTTRTTRAAATATSDECEAKPTPLSPKKVPQLSLNRKADPGGSDEEFAATPPKAQTPIRPLQRSPIRSAIFSGRIFKPSIFPEADCKNLETSGKHGIQVSTDNHTVLDPPDMNNASALLAKPVRRMPQPDWKDSLRSPAKRGEGLQVHLNQSCTRPNGVAPQAEVRASLLQSPAKRGQGIQLNSVQSATRPNGVAPQVETKKSLLQSPAKRMGVWSPVKDLGFGASMPNTPSFEKSLSSSPAKRGTASLFKLDLPKRTAEATHDLTSESAFPCPVPDTNLFISEAADSGLENNQYELSEDADGLCHCETALSESPQALIFPGRLSAVLPRSADPNLSDFGLLMPKSEMQALKTTEVTNEKAADVNIQSEDPMALDEPVEEEETDVEVEEQEEDEEKKQAQKQEPKAPPLHARPGFGLREKDTQSEYDSEQEDELSPRRPLRNAVPATPMPTQATQTQGSAARSCTGRPSAKRLRTDKQLGFTPLVQKLSRWTAGTSPLKLGSPVETLRFRDAHQGEFLEVVEATLTATASRACEPMQDHYFEDEMMVRSDSEAQDEMMAEVEGPDFEATRVTDDDMALAVEAYGMSLMEPEQVEETFDRTSESMDDSNSENSQEYGDENAAPIEPSLLAGDAHEPGMPPITPQRRLVRREVHTVSKVPLKPADESTPRPQMRKLAHSISRLPVQRPTQGLVRNATVISYSPTKLVKEETPEPEERVQEEMSQAGSAPPATPAMTAFEAVWSAMGTPARTPRRDLKPDLLNGVVVHVDVHTSEGADASGIFVELLTQMGARCVNQWPWDPLEASSSSKIGITHIVYKDGSKRTLEKVRQTNGVVQCVGVSWVLDCERENQYLDEAPYYIDTSSLPRGGRRRRKSMEPKTLAQLNGVLVPTPMRNASSAREVQSAPATPVQTNRRESGLWMHTPEDGDSSLEGEQEKHDDSVWDDHLLLTPVPKTPAPETIAQYAEAVTRGFFSPTGGLYEDDTDGDEADQGAAMMMQTCPPKPSQGPSVDLSEGVLGRHKDKSVMMRLMAARRKSLQFAPKVASPLSKAW